MGFLDNLTKANKSGVKEEWKNLTDIQQLDQLVEDSNSKPVVIFKHSVRCGTSFMVKSHLEGDWDFASEDLDFYYLDLINNRNISNQIADRFDVIHQSPQLIVLKNGETVNDTSHHMISVNWIKQAIS